MESFKLFILNFAEVLDSHSMDQRASQGQWKQSPKGAVYDFVIPSDPDTQYQVAVSQRGSVDFSNSETGHNDRFKISKGGMRSTMEVMNTVMSALIQYVKQYNPPFLTWSGIKKTRYQANNSDARAKIYYNLASKHMFGSYVPINMNTWYRVDVYNQSAANDGLPQFNQLDVQGGADQWLQKIEQYKLSQKQQAKTLQDLEVRNRDQRQRDNEEWYMSPAGQLNRQNLERQQAEEQARRRHEYEQWVQRGRPQELIDTGEVED